MTEPTHASPLDGLASFVGVFERLIRQADRAGESNTLAGQLVVELRDESSRSGDTSRVHHLVLTGDGLQRWVAGPAPAPDLVLDQAPSVQADMLLGARDGTGLLRSSRVLDTRSGEWKPCPPADELDGRWSEGLLEVPNARSFTLQQHLTGSPFGRVAIHYTFDKGRLLRCGLGELGDADIVVERPYSAALEERAGQLDVLDSLDGGRLTGDVVHLALFLGIHESDECLSSRRQLAAPFDAPLAALGEVLHSSWWRESVVPILRPVIGEPS